MRGHTHEVIDNILRIGGIVKFFITESEDYMGKVVKLVVCSVAMLSMVYTAVSCYMLAGFFAANSGIELPMWGRMMSICANVLAWISGAK